MFTRTLLHLHHIGCALTIQASLNAFGSYFNNLLRDNRQSPLANL